jgi:hypothetical protein
VFFATVLETKVAKVGSPGRTRTSDQRINSPTFLPLIADESIIKSLRNG